ncbi:MAG TPA: DUF3179 domain-containing (seleno)protein [Puia sp.]|nr:DUF3179 domain-containing (seleno)protein [Puia sp.]
MRRLLLILGFFLLFATEILRVYFIMPFPGSQHRNTLQLAYFIDQHRIWFRILGFVIIGYALLIQPAKRANPYAPRRKKSNWPAVALIFFTVLYAVVFYLFNYRFEADNMFHQPHSLSFTDSSNHRLDEQRLVIGVVVGGEARAYPIRLIGYHHQVRDSLGHQAIMITYCTVCRTGRVYSPLVYGRPQTFRLVGMDHFNAMFEDEKTGSWWQQATGVAVAGPLKGTKLAEIPSGQFTLGAWLHMHPDSKIMQPDSSYTKQYANLDDYDNGKIEGSLEHRDSGSWKAKSWVIGVLAGGHARAYDWSTLGPVTEDSVGTVPVLVYRQDSVNFRVWSRLVDGKTLRFKPAIREILGAGLTDDATGGFWNGDGICIDGPLKGRHLQPMQSYQEFWHSWRYFHPGTTRFKR